MKKGLLFTLVLLVGVVALTGCGKKEKKDPIVGKWALGSFVYTFNSDGTCNYSAAGDCTYKINGDKISITYDGMTVPFESTFSIDGNKLNIKDSFGNDTIYTKK